MAGSHTPLPLVSCTLLLLASTSGAGHDPPAVGRADSRRFLLLDTVRKGILGSLGMDREPRPARKASPQELRRIYQLYEETTNKAKRNSSQAQREPRQAPTSTLLFPVKLVKVLQRRVRRRSGQPIRWYRAVFRKNPNILGEPTLTRAELRISGDHLYSRQTGARQAVKVRVNGRKGVNCAAWTDSEPQSNTSSSQAVTLDVSAEVQGWRRTAADALLVDVGLAVANPDVPTPRPTVTLQLGPAAPHHGGRTRPRRSDKEDHCDERGWCCRRSVTVSFKEIGWTDWVVAPAEYTMNFCDGACPHNYKPASMHTQVKSRLHQMGRGGAPRPCCVPAAYEPMVLMHYDSRGRLKLTPFTDLVVSKCHCA